MTAPAPLFAVTQVSNHFWWYVARASGITAGIAVLATVVWGLLLVTKVVQRRGLPAWLDALHRHLGAVTVALVGVHMFALWADSYTQFDLRDLLVPLASSWRPWPVAAGVVAMWLLVLVEVSSQLRSRLPRRLWRAVHLSSYAAVLLVVVHTVTSGHDVGNRVFVPVLAALSTLLVFLVVVRVAGSKGARGGDADRAARLDAVRRARADAPAAPSDADAGTADPSTASAPGLAGVPVVDLPPAPVAPPPLPADLAVPAVPPEGLPSPYDPPRDPPPPAPSPWSSLPE